MTVKHWKEWHQTSFKEKLNSFLVASAPFIQLCARKQAHARTLHTKEPRNAHNQKHIIHTHRHTCTHKDRTTYTITQEHNSYTALSAEHSETTWVVDNIVLRKWAIIINKPLKPLFAKLPAWQRYSISLLQFALHPTQLTALFHTRSLGAPPGPNF